MVPSVMKGHVLHLTKFFVMRYPIRVWYRGQVQVCNICRRSEHRAASCPLRDVSLKCRRGGHFARDCPGVSADVPLADVSLAMLLMFLSPMFLLAFLLRTFPLLLVLSLQ